MFDGVKKAWAESQARLMENEYEAAKATLDGLSGELSGRACQVFFDAHEITLSQIGSFENITLEGRNKLMQAFRADAKSCRDFDISKSTGLKLYSLWLESMSQNSDEAMYVHYQTGLLFEARRLLQEYPLQEVEEYPLREVRERQLEDAQERLLRMAISNVPYSKSPSPVDKFEPLAAMLGKYGSSQNNIFNTLLISGCPNDLARVLANRFGKSNAS